MPGETLKSFAGTPKWTAPEVFRSNHGRLAVDESSDIWSLGMTVIEMATGGLPYEVRDKTAEEVRF